MAILLDTSILVRLADLNDPQHTLAADAVLKLHRQGEILHITPQISQRGHTARFVERGRAQHRRGGVPCRHL